MSAIRRKLKSFTIEAYSESQAPSGDWVRRWRKHKSIMGAIYSKKSHDALAKAMGVNFLEYSDILLTDEAGLIPGKHRLKDGKDIYSVEHVISDGRKKQVFLKRVEEAAK